MVINRSITITRLEIVLVDLHKLYGEIKRRKSYGLFKDNYLKIGDLTGESNVHH